MRSPRLLFAILMTIPLSVHAVENTWEKLPYNNPGLVVDLGVGLWAHPLPVDYDRDGDLDLVVSTADVPSNGVYFFENPGGSTRDPIFKPGVRLGDGLKDVTLSMVEGKPVILTPNAIRVGFFEGNLEETLGLSVEAELGHAKTRANQWRLCDYDQDGLTDVVIGLGVWTDYGWDDAFNSRGEWTRGPLHGYVYVARNTRSNESPTYAAPVQLMAGGGPVDVFGAPSPNFADWDKDGDLDLLCGSFLDDFTYFENIGDPGAPEYADGRRLAYAGTPLHMDLEMLQAAAIDWDRDGDTDLIVGQEDGRVALVENTGKLIGATPEFLPPRFFRQEADKLKVGALVTPFSVDWDADGDEDLLAGDTAGYVNFVENLDGGNPPQWAAPVYLDADGETIRIQAGENGSIQGPAEGKWGYTVLNAADWNHDGLIDVVINSIWGKILWYENAGTATHPRLKRAQPIEVAWEGKTPKPDWYWWEPEGKALVTQWRTTPLLRDINEDGLIDLIMLDTEGYLSFYERTKVGDGGLALLPPKRIFEDASGQPLRLNENRAGRSGRRKFTFSDWDQDGRLDILINGANIEFLRNVSDEAGGFRFESQGLVDERKLAGHTTCPTIVDWDKNGIPDLLIGAEDGFFYYKRNPLGQ